MTKGTELEKLINKVNLALRKNKQALISKLATPIIYTNNGLIAQMSTVDYTGLIDGGRFVAFDAKETESTTSFPLKNIHDHQLLYLNMVESLGGVAFFLIWFKKVHNDKVYIVPLKLINDTITENKRKSIPIDQFKEEWLTTIDAYINKLRELHGI